MKRKRAKTIKHVKSRRVGAKNNDVDDEDYTKNLDFIL